MKPNLSRPVHVAGLVSAILADVALSRIALLAGGRRVQPNQLVPLVFREATKLAPDAAPQMLAWVRSYREVIDRFVAIIELGRTVERVALLDQRHAAFVEHSLALLDKRAARP